MSGKQASVHKIKQALTHNRISGDLGYGILAKIFKHAILCNFMELKLVNTYLLLTFILLILY